MQDKYKHMMLVMRGERREKKIDATSVVEKCQCDAHRTILLTFNNDLCHLGGHFVCILYNTLIFTRIRPFVHEIDHNSTISERSLPMIVW